LRSDEARQRLAELEALRPQFVEQPTSSAALAELGRCAVPWAADESLQDPQQLAPLLDAAGCVAWVLKPALLGLRRARELALLAQQRGLGVVITHLFDGPVGLAAACELALSLPTVPWACGLDRHPGLAAWPAVALPHHRPNSPAAIQPHGGCGLGFALAGLPWG
jgi:L-alanine-DL-glutamate epimerase-like enolase superfamily enzyme